MPIKNRNANFAAFSMLLMMGCQAMPSAKPTGARTPEEALEMFVLSHDAAQMTAVVDTSTDEGKRIMEMVPILCQNAQALHEINTALTVKYGAANRACACAERIPNPSEGLREMIGVLNSPQCKRTENRVAIPVEHDFLVLIRDSKGFWKIQALPGMPPKEALALHAKRMSLLSRHIIANLNQCPTPEACAVMIAMLDAQIDRKDPRDPGNGETLSKQAGSHPPKLNGNQLLITVKANGDLVFYGKRFSSRDPQDLAYLSEFLQRAASGHKDTLEVLIFQEEKAPLSAIEMASAAASFAVSSKNICVVK